MQFEAKKSERYIKKKKILKKDLQITPKKGII